MNDKSKKSLWLTFLLMFLGCAVLSFGIYNVHSQSKITEGGVLGGVLLIQHWFKISPSISGFIMDITCYIIGWRVLGNSFLAKAIFSSLSFSLTYRLWETTGPFIPDLSAYPFIAAVLGGIFVGVGVGIVVRQGGAAGGDDTLALLISKFFKIPISKAYLSTDITVLTLSLSYIPFKNIFFSLITVTISSFLIGKIQNFSAKERCNV